MPLRLRATRTVLILLSMFIAVYGFCQAAVRRSGARSGPGGDGRLGCPSPGAALHPNPRSEVRANPLRRSLRFQRVLALLLLGNFAIVLAGCHSRPKLPEKGSKAYAAVGSAFYVGLAALQVGDDVHAESKLSEVTKLVPTEPAGWANWGVLALRQRNYDLAAYRLPPARVLAPHNDQIYDLIGILEGDRGHSAQAIASLRKGVDLNPKIGRA